MSRDDSEFAAYLAARWPSLVRTLVLLEVPEGTAHRVAVDALTRIYPEFPRLSREEDVDVAVYRELLDARDRRARRAPDGPEPVPAACGPVPPPDVPAWLVEPLERLEQLRAALDTMTPGDREAVVLGHVAELSDDQVADVLETYPGARLSLAAPDVRLALEAIPVEPLDAAQVAEATRARRRKVWTRAGGVAAVLVVLLVAVSWAVDRLDSVGDVEQVANPLPVAWYADGTLHLADVTVGVRPVLQLVTVPDGVVLSDDQGNVVLVQDDGEQQEIGETVVGSALVAEPDNGWVAWADPAAGDPRLVVFDTRVGDEVGHRSLETRSAGGGQPVGQSRPIAIDGEQVYYHLDGTDYAWEPLPGSAFSLSGALVDVASGARLSRGPEPTDLLVQARPFDTGSRFVGTFARLTPDGRYVMVAVDDDLVVYDAATGEEVPRMHSPSDQALSWTYAGDDTFLVTVLHMLQDKQYQDTLQMPDQGDYRIYECVPGRADACVEAHRVKRTSVEPPVLAR